MKGAMMKRPAALAKDPTTKQQLAVMKRPAGKEEPNDEQEGDGDATRDRLKMLAIERMHDNLPDWAQQTWQQLQGRGKRADRTRFVNEVVVRDAKGKYKFDSRAPVMKEYHDKYQESFGQDCKRGLEI